MELPQLYDTILGEGGVKLSGGQRQRVILAGQFLRDVDIFIFDEATNHLDPKVEDGIYTALGNLGEDKTIIIINHRDSVLNICNREWLISNSNVIEIVK
jgi:ABC-type bacteriocin/lantibiotic exporter with double-glycine peptidase domain